MRLFNQLLAERSIEVAHTGGEAEYTGRYLVLLEEGSGQDAIDAVSDAGQLNVMSASPDGDEISSDQIREADAVVFPAIDVALVDAPPSSVKGLTVATTERSPILAVEPERIVHVAGVSVFDMLAAESPAAETHEVSPEYRHGYRDAILDLTGARAPEETTLRLDDHVTAEAATTWGLTAVGVGASTRTASGIKVAVLDTGFYRGHDDFQGRTIQSMSFISGETVEDGHGHGTHCIGTACGPTTSQQGRYGIASDCDIFAGKVLSNGGSGGDGGILAGIDWAVRSGCRVISMSLGSRVRAGQRPSTVYENAARRALQKGSLIVAAAGNDSARPRMTSPVSHPANCPSIMAVGAVDSRMKIAPFSNRAMNPNGGEVNLVGPGVLVNSSWIEPQRYRRISGTSMATPHVAGVAAVICEETGQRGLQLAWEMLRRCRNVGLSVADGGRGLVRVN
ncbi:MAG TPA: S8 family serine peptidase [Actinomycetota bacterium]|nr:S8 family serine peptidase [Actinomycetota bacterium]